MEKGMVLSCHRARGPNAKGPLHRGIQSIVVLWYIGIHVICRLTLRKSRSISLKFKNWKILKCELLIPLVHYTVDILAAVLGYVVTLG
jgi:hypothetical protein